MAKVTAFKATPKLAAMSQQAAQVLAGKNMAIAPGGMAVQRPTPQPTVYPQTLRDRAPQLTGGGMTRMSPVMNQALMLNPWRAQSYNAADAARAAGGGAGPGGDLENADQFLDNKAGFYHKLGLTGEDVNAAAWKYAAGRSYGGNAYMPGLVMREGTVEYQNGRPGIYIKYRQGTTSSTEWTPLDQPQEQGPAPPPSGGWKW